MAWKVLSHLTSHLPDEAPFRALKKGVRQSEYLKMNLFNVVSFPIMACVRFLVLGDCICRTTQACLGARKSRNFPDSTPKAHLSGFNRRWCNLVN